MAFFTIVMAIATVFYAGVTYLQWKTVEETLQLGREQMKLAKAQFDLSESQYKQQAETTEAMLAAAGRNASAAERSATDARAIARLDVEPDIRLEAYLHPVKLPSGEEIPPRIVASNSGPLDASHVQLTLMHVLKTSSKKGFAVMSGTDWRWNLPRLDAGKSWMVFPAQAVSLIVVTGAPEQNAILLLLEYRRDSDLKLFKGWSLFVLNKEGSWEHDYNDSVDAEMFQPIIRRLLESKEDVIFRNGDLKRHK